MEAFKGSVGGTGRLFPCALKKLEESLVLLPPVGLSSLLVLCATSSSRGSRGGGKSACTAGGRGRAGARGKGEMGMEILDHPPHLPSPTHWGVPPRAPPPGPPCWHWRGGSKGPIPRAGAPPRPTHIQATGGRPLCPGVKHTPGAIHCPACILMDGQAVIGK